MRSFNRLRRHHIKVREPIGYLKIYRLHGKLNITASEKEKHTWYIFKGVAMYAYWVLRSRRLRDSLGWVLGIASEKIEKFIHEPLTILGVIMRSFNRLRRRHIKVREPIGYLKIYRLHGKLNYILNRHY